MGTFLFELEPQKSLELCSLCCGTQLHFLKHESPKCHKRTALLLTRQGSEPLRRDVTLVSAGALATPSHLAGPPSSWTEKPGGCSFEGFICLIFTKGILTGFMDAAPVGSARPRASRSHPQYPPSCSRVPGDWSHTDYLFKKLLDGWPVRRDSLSLAEWRMEANLNTSALQMLNSSSMPTAKLGYAANSEALCWSPSRNKMPQYSGVLTKRYLGGADE